MAHTLMFLDPGHFHAALVLREAQPAVDDQIFVYAPDGPELRDFLGLVEAFNRRSERPTRWRATVDTSSDSLRRLIAGRPGDVVVLAGRNDGKAAVMRRLHDAGLPVLADKPWLAGPEGLGDIRHVLSGGPLAMEMMTGHHEVTGAILERLVAARDLFGGFAPGEHAGPAIRLASRHHLAKTVNGASLRRPPWFFDVRVQGDGLADIPTHMVDRAQRLVAAAGAGDPADIELVSARRWPTVVPRAVFARITGSAEFPPEVAGLVEDGALAYLGNGELRARIGGVPVELVTRWELEEPAGGGDTHEVVVRGARADLRIEQGEATGYRRRLLVVPNGPPAETREALTRSVSAWPADLLGIEIAETADGLELRLPAALGSGHEEHFALVLRTFLERVDTGAWPPDLAGRTLAKYTLLAEAGIRARKLG